jgi:hypothetical protein
MSRTAATSETTGETAGSGPAGVADQADQAGRDDQGWRASWPELVLAGLLVAAVSLAGYAFAGPGAPAVVLIFTSGLVLILLRGMAPPAAAPLPPDPDTGTDRALPSFSGFFRKRSALVSATASRPAFDTQLRETLQRLLAARLAERHGISFYQDPEAARRALFPGGTDNGLWFWLDPGRPAADSTDSQPGIRPRALATLIERLERL